MRVFILHIICGLCFLLIDKPVAAISVSPDCQVSINTIEVGECANLDGTVTVSIEGTTDSDFLTVEYGVDQVFYFAEVHIGDDGTWTSNFHVVGDVLVYVDAIAGTSSSGCSDFYFALIPLPTESCPDDVNTLIFNQNNPTDCAPEIAEVKIYDTGSDVLKHDLNAVFDAERGAYVLVNPPVGIFDLFIKPHACLQQGYQGLTIVSGEQNIGMSQLHFGDIDNSNAINIVDFSLLSNAFNTLPGDANYNSTADLNCIDGINILDFSLLSISFNEIGEEP